MHTKTSKPHAPRGQQAPNTSKHKLQAADQNNSKSNRSWMTDILHPAAYFHFIHAFGNGRRSYVSEPIAKSVEWKYSKKRRRPMQCESQVTYFAANNKWSYLYCSCIFKVW